VSVKKPFDFPPSDEFVTVVTAGGGIVNTCELCGRECFEDDAHAGDWEPGELEALREKAKNDPEKYIPMDTVRTGYFDGKQVVTNCPCNLLRPFENWIWQHRHIIADFVQRRTVRIAEDALSDEAEGEFLKEAAEREEDKREFQKCQGCQGYFDKETIDERLLCKRCAEDAPVAPVAPVVKEDPQNWDGEDDLPF
jgi:hypothetical protein